MNSGARAGSGKREVISLIGAVFLGAILVIATIGKVIDPIVFVEQIRKEGLEVFFSANTVALIALGLEMGLGTALLLGVRCLWILIPTSALVAFFLFLTSRTYWQVLTGQRDDSYDCGCFGVFLERNASEAFWQDLLLLLPALILAFLCREALFRKPSAWKLAVAVISAAAVLGYTVWFAGLPPSNLVEFEQPQASESREMRVSEQFVLLIDGEPDADGEIFETDSSLKLLLISPQLSSPLVLDVLNSTVRKLESTVLQRTEQGNLRVDLPDNLEEVATFQIESSGLRFELEGHVVELRTP